MVIRAWPLVQAIGTPGRCVTARVSSGKAISAMVTPSAVATSASARTSHRALRRKRPITCNNCARRPTTRELAIGRCQEGGHPQPARVECVLNLGTRDQRLRERPGGQRHEGRRCYDSSGSTRLGSIHRSMMPPHWMSQLESTLNGRSPPLPRITVSRVDPAPGTSAHMQKRADSIGNPPSLVGSV